MTAPVDYSWKIEDERSQRNDAEHAARVRAARARIVAELAAKRERIQRSPARIQTCRPQSATRHAWHGANPSSVPTLLPVPAEEKPALVRISWRLKLKEKFRPGAQTRRVAAEFQNAQAIPEQPDPRNRQPVELPSLPGAGIQKLKEQDEQSLSSWPVDETDANMTQGDCDNEISALPPLRGWRREASTPHRDFLFSQNLEVQDEDPSLEDLMDETLDAADAPGNRLSVRPSLPPQWRAAEFSMMMSRDLRQQEARGSTELPPLPNAVLSPGPGYLPNLSVSNSVPNLRTTWIEGRAKRPASGKCFGSADRQG